MLALSVSISTSSSPLDTSSPSDFSHLRIVPSSIESDRRGIATSAMAASVPLLRRSGACPAGRRGPPAGGPRRVAEARQRGGGGPALAVHRGLGLGHQELRSRAAVARAERAPDGGGE